MKPRPRDPAPRFGSILPGEVLPLVEAGRRLGLAKRALIDAQKMGLRSVLIGRRKFTTGNWLLAFVEGQAEKADETEVSRLLADFTDHGTEARP